MKLNQILLFVGGILLQTTNLFGQTNCPNGNAENNNLGNWITMTGAATGPKVVSHKVCKHSKKLF